MEKSCNMPLYLIFSFEQTDDDDDELMTDHWIVEFNNRFLFKIHVLDELDKFLWTKYKKKKRKIS